MQQNMSAPDRGIRLVAAVLLVWLGIAAGAGSVAGVLGFVVAAVLAATAAAGFCPLYAALGIATRHRGAGV